MGRPNAIKRLFGAIVGAVLLLGGAVPAFSQTDSWNAQPFVTGTLTYITLSDGGLLPSTATWITQNAFVTITMYQDKGYMNGTYVTLNSPSVVNSLGGGGTGTSPQTSYDFLSWFVNYTASAASSSSTGYRAFGTFRLHVVFSSSSGGAGTVYFGKDYVWNFSPVDAQNGQGEQLQQIAQGNANTVAAINAQNVNQDNFWTGLFVPNQSDIDACKQAVNQFMSWGPFGLFSTIKGEFPGSSSTGLAIDPTPYKINFGFPYTANGLTFDLTPYQDYIKFVRAIFSGAMWFIFLFVMWKRVYAKV